MKEFSSQTGGRYTYVEDILNLQELALANLSIFDGCNNFVISGCKCLDSGSGLSSGYVYINGRVRYFAGASGLTTWPVYICENNSTEVVPYVTGGSKVGRTNYGTRLSNKKPTTVDSITGKATQWVEVYPSGATSTIREAFFGKYAVIQNSNDEQIIDSKTTYNDAVNIEGVLSVADCIRIGDDTNTITLNNDNDSRVISSVFNNDIVNEVVFDKNSISVVLSSTTAMSITRSTMQINLPVAATSASLGDVKISGDGLYNYADASDNGSVYINYGDSSCNYYRNTVIGDGKGKAIVTVDGSHNKTTFDSCVVVEGASVDVFCIKNTQYNASDARLMCTMAWNSADEKQIALLGYNSDSDSRFTVYNALGDIVLTPATGCTVNVNADIKEQGIKLSNKYASLNEYNAHIENYDAHIKEYDAHIEAYNTKIAEYDRKIADLTARYNQLHTAILNNQVIITQ
jgi:hypothetical protein